MKFKYLTMSSKEDFEESVARLLEEGWSLYGNTTCHLSRNDLTYYCQALTWGYEE